MISFTGSELSKLSSDSVNRLMTISSRVRDGSHMMHIHTLSCQRITITVGKDSPSHPEIKFMKETRRAAYILS